MDYGGRLIPSLFNEETMDDTNIKTLSSNSNDVFSFSKAPPGYSPSSPPPSYSPRDKTEEGYCTCDRRVIRERKLVTILTVIIMILISITVGVIFKHLELLYDSAKKN